jgi:hypothetical protein
VSRPSIMAQVAETAKLGRESAARNKAADVVATTIREPSARAYRDA